MRAIVRNSGKVGLRTAAELGTAGAALPTNAAELPFVAGRFAVFGQWTEINNASEGQFLERIGEGAFRQTIREDRPYMRLLYEHGKDPFIGSRPIAPIDVLGEDAQGVYYAGRMLDTMAARELIPGLQAGLYGSSFRFMVPPGGDEWVRAPKASSYNPQRLQERTIRRAVVYEFGPVTFPAYSGATAGLGAASVPPRSRPRPLAREEWLDKVLPLPPGVSAPSTAAEREARRRWLDRVMPLPRGWTQ